MLEFVTMRKKLTETNILAVVRLMTKLPSAARQTHIRERLAAEPGVSVSQLASEFGVSEMTVRRDLDALAASAHIERTHGGAVLTTRMVVDFDYRRRREVQRASKQSIARAARAMVQPGQRILLDTGTTTLELAVLLRDAVDLTVITPSLAVASELQDASGVEVILLGGVIRRGSPDLTGPVTEHCLDLFSADLAFQGADGIGLDGAIYNSDLRLARVDKLMRRLAAKSCVLADHTKIGVTALAKSGSLAEVDYFVTDSACPPAARKRFARLGPQVITVDVPSSS